MPVTMTSDEVVLQKIFTLEIFDLSLGQTAIQNEVSMKSMIFVRSNCNPK